MIYTDHQLLKHLFNDFHPVAVMASSHILRWTMTLGAYHYSIGYKPGRNHGNADKLSRLHLSEEAEHVPMPADVVLVLNQIELTSVKAFQMKSWTEQDPTLSKVKWHYMTASGIKPLKTQ